MVSQYTHLSREQSARSIRWFSRQNDATRLEVVKLQKKQFHRLKNLNPDADDFNIITLAAFEIACYLSHQSMLVKSKKNTQNDLNMIKKTTGIRSKAIKKEKARPLYEKLLNLNSKLIELIEVEQCSYAEVSKYLKRYHSIHVSRQYIGKTYNNIKGKQNV